MQIFPRFRGGVRQDGGGLVWDDVNQAWVDVIETGFIVDIYTDNYQIVKESNATISYTVDSSGISLLAGRTAAAYTYSNTFLKTPVDCTGYQTALIYGDVLELGDTGGYTIDIGFKTSTTLATDNTIPGKIYSIGEFVLNLDISRYSSLYFTIIFRAENAKCIVKKIILK